MDNKTIETLAVDAVKDSIILTDCLDPFIADNDKEPSWDGFIYIYKSERKKKDNLQGRLAVQVKGKEIKSAFKRKITHPVAIVDLKNYLHNGGVLYFVVHINSSTQKRQIYYVDLTPVQIRIILREAKNQITKNIEMSEFPSDSIHKQLIVKSCYDNCQRQASFSDAELPSLESLEKSGLLETLSIRIPATAGVDPIDALVENGGYLYANLKGNVIPQPLEMIAKNLVVTEEKAVTVSVKDRVFYTSVQVERNASTMKVVLGKSFFITINKKNHTTKYRYESNDSLRSRVIDLDFILSCIENEGFTYAGAFLPFKTSEAVFSNFDVEKERNSLKRLQMILKAIDVLGCQKDLNLKSLTQDDYRNLDSLVHAFVLHDTLPASENKDMPLVFFISIKDLNFLVCINPVDEKSENFFLCDFFNCDFSVNIIDGSERTPVSQYVILSADALLQADNFKPERLLPSFQNMDDRYTAIGRANTFMLSLIEAYDKDNKRVEFLQAADEFADWIMEATEEELPYNIRILNKLQIKKRQKGLTGDQIKKLYEVIESDAREDVKTGAYLLLDQQQAAEIHFERIDKDMQEEFKKYPIYHFWNESKGEQHG